MRARSSKYLDLGDVVAAMVGLVRNQVSGFEKEFAAYIGTRYAIGTSYGRTALYLGLKAVGIKNKEVLIPSFICTAVRHAVVKAGGVARFVDVNAEDLTFDIKDLLKKITKNTKAIVLTHYFGGVAKNIEDVIALARDYGLVLIEDCAHSLGARYKGRKVGGFGDFAIYSLTKSMINFGGGVLTTNDYDIYVSAREILSEDNRALMKRVADFPMILACGLEQAIEKLVLDRVGRSGFRWNLTYIPRVLLHLRRSAIKVIKAPSAIRKRSKEVVEGRGSSRATEPVGSYEQGINMEPIIASVGRRQLRKLDALIERRKAVFRDLMQLGNYPLRDSGGLGREDVFTYVVLRFPNTDIFRVIEKCKHDGLLLRATWPTHQKLWESQNTENVRKLKEQFLTWSVSPMLKKKERENFVRILKEYV